MTDTATPNGMVEEAARLLAEVERASLATRLAKGAPAGLPDGLPYVSLVLLAREAPARLFLLLSDLSEHAKNLQADPHLALLLDQTADKAEPLAEPRLTLLGRADPVADEGEIGTLKEAFVAAHPKSKVWAGFTDFRPYRLTWTAAHFVAGFGRIAWLLPADLQASLEKGS